MVTADLQLSTKGIGFLTVASVSVLIPPQRTTTAFIDILHEEIRIRDRLVTWILVVLEIQTRTQLLARSQRIRHIAISASPLIGIGIMATGTGSTTGEF